MMEICREVLYQYSEMLKEETNAVLLPLVYLGDRNIKHIVIKILQRVRYTV